MNKYFVYDFGEGFSIHKTQKEALKEMQRRIDSCRGDEWDEEVEDIVSGIITHCVKQCDVVNRPKHLSQLGKDSNGIFWDDDEKYKCDYKIAEIDKQEE